MKTQIETIRGVTKTEKRRQMENVWNFLIKFFEIVGAILIGGYFVSIENKPIKLILLIIGIILLGLSIKLESNRDKKINEKLREKE